MIKICAFAVQSDLTALDKFIKAEEAMKNIFAEQGWASEESMDSLGLPKSDFQMAQAEKNRKVGNQSESLHRLRIFSFYHPKMIELRNSFAKASEERKSKRINKIKEKEREWEEEDITAAILKFRKSKKALSDEIKALMTTLTTVSFGVIIFGTNK